MRDKHPVDLLVLNAQIYTFDCDDTVYGDGGLAVLGGRIVAIGESDALRTAYRATETIDARGSLVFPGLIDTHLHPSFSFTRTPIPERRGSWTYEGDTGLRASRPPGPLSRAAHEEMGANMVPFSADIQRLEQMPPTMVYAFSLHSLLMAIRSGVTCFVDGGGGPAEGVAQAAVDIGIRAGVGHLAADVLPERSGSGLSLRRIHDVDSQLRATEAVIDRWHGAANGRVSGWCNAIMDVTASDELLDGLAALARDRKTGFTTHTASAYSQQAMSEALHGKRGVLRMQEHGTLGPNWLGIHMGFVDDAEIAALAESGSQVSHCPGTSLRCGKGIIADGRIIRMMEAGVNVGLGTDTISQGLQLDQLKFCELTHREAFADDRLMPAYHVMTLATRNAARCVGLEDQVGQLESGRRADFIVVNNRRPDYLSMNPVDAFVRFSQPADIESVVIDGRLVLHHGELRTMDQEWIEAQTYASVAALAAQTGN